MEAETIYERAVTEERQMKKTLLEYKMYSAEEVAQIVHNRYKSWDMDKGTDHAQRYPFGKILAVVKNSLEKLGENGNLVG
ncbi:MAG: hypothetical protein KAT65_02585, partial [Methanophagales archaeon]|nr:hypothetical protein [Methanophagales archaeon]